MRRGPILLVLLAAATLGCAYYNGMYNAKRLAGKARKAERDQRTFEAAGLWGQVSIKAESVLVRHPDSKWAEEARLLRATALVRLRDCGQALPELEAVMGTGRNPEFVERAAMMAGKCYLQVDDPAAATSAYARLLESRNPARRDVARWAHGRAELMAGNDEVALQELSTTSDVRARGYLAAAYAGTGRSAEALALADTLLQPPVDTTVPWEIIVGRLGRHDPEAASELTSRVALESSLPATMRARLLAADAVRFDGFDSIRVHRRLFQAESIATGTTVQGDIVLLRARLLLRDETDPARLRQHAGQLVEVAEAGGPVAPVLFRIAATLDRAVQVAESVPAGAPLGDLRLFLAAESVRDSAGAKAFARGTFERIPEGWPDSPYAAKAVMALKDLNPDASDSLDHLLASRYGGSPYVAAASGGDGREILVLEDSLRRYAATLSRPTRPQPARPGQRPRPQPARPAEELP